VQGVDVDPVHDLGHPRAELAGGVPQAELGALVERGLG